MNKEEKFDKEKKSMYREFFLLQDVLKDGATFTAYKPFDEDDHQQNSNVIIEEEDHDKQ